MKGGKAMKEVMIAFCITALIGCASPGRQQSDEERLHGLDGMIEATIGDTYIIVNGESLDEETLKRIFEKGVVGVHISITNELLTEDERSTQSEGQGSVTPTVDVSPDLGSLLK
jgi:hypothetical protein